MSDSSNAIPRIIRCRQCGQRTEYSPRNPFRPFCSERCKLMDLGAWAEGRHALPAEPSELTEADLEALEHSTGESQSGAEAGGEQDKDS